MGSSASKSKSSSSGATKRSNGYSSSSDYSSAHHMSAHLANLALAGASLGDSGPGNYGGGMNNQQYLYHQLPWRKSRWSQTPQQHYSNNGSNHHLQQMQKQQLHQHHHNRNHHRHPSRNLHLPTRNQQREFELASQYYDPLLMTASYDDGCVRSAKGTVLTPATANTAPTATNRGVAAIATAAANTFSLANSKARRFKGASRHKVVARFSRSQPDFCSECIEADCSCTSAISSENDNIETQFEENIDGIPSLVKIPRSSNNKRYYIPNQKESRKKHHFYGTEQQQEVLTEEEIFNRIRDYRQANLDDSDLHLSNTLAFNEQRVRSSLSENMAASTTNDYRSNNGQTNNKATDEFASCHKMPSVERGLALNREDREKHGLLGLLPAAVQDEDLQSRAVMNFLDNCNDPLSKYVYLRHLKDFNEKLFYHTITKNVEKCMPLVYTPTVGLACQKFSEIYMRPRGLFITANDSGRVKKILANWPEKDVRVIVVTDGERILGLGDLGANGMGISIGKLSLYTALAGIPPQNVLPITIDVGTNNQTYLDDPYYIGLRQTRVRGEKYDQLIEEFMHAVVERWGRSCLVQFEDFGNSTAFNLLSRYRDEYCTFNDDIQGTASVCLSGLISATKMVGKRLRECSFLFYGAGEANLGTAQLLVMAMIEDGLGENEAKRHIWLVDSKGLVISKRTDLSSHKRKFAQDVPPLRDLEDIISYTKPSAIIGASAQSGSFNESICKKMTEYNARPIIFALSNPTSKAECTADQAYRWTDGKCVFASGSPFDPVEYNGKTFVTGQGNNAYIFPAVGLAAIGAHTHMIPEETFLVAARALSDLVTNADTEVGLVYPRLDKIRDVTLRIATRVLEYFYTERLATYRPEPTDKLEFLKAIQYNTRY